VTTGLERIAARFAALKAKNQAGFVAYVMAGDPDLQTTAAILDGLPGAGVDIVELGFPFSDPMADGPSIQRAGQRALKGGTTLKKTIELAAGFRAKHPDTPLILMGYLNPIDTMGAKVFAQKAKAAGIDGAIIVDAPPEEDEELQKIFADHGLALIRLAAPTSDERRMNTILSGAHGFLYYVSVTGVTGVKAVATDAAAQAVARVRGLTDLPVAVGFGVRTPEQAAAMAIGADAVVVGSAIVDAIEQGSSASPQNAAAQALDLVRRLSEATHDARKQD
jgi:tryptophan synthase alpha chain